MGFGRAALERCFVTWLTPAELDLEHWRWTRMKPQRGGFARGLWRELQDTWRRAVEGV